MARARARVRARAKVRPRAKVRARVGARARVRLGLIHLHPKGFVLLNVMSIGKFHTKFFRGLLDLLVV